ncbi:MAG TPA: hypothetical protein VFL55_20345 [Acetobacteraceae bacterium]|nr:hypothetical protein [Acetobacteraceae bacterium]
MIIATICGFELAMLLYVTGLRSIGGNQTVGEAFWIGHDAVVRAILEECSFLAVILAAIIGSIALYVADSQLRAFVRQSAAFVEHNRQSEAARTASVYMEVSSKWDSETVAGAREFLSSLQQEFDALAADQRDPRITTPSHYIHQRIQIQGDEKAYAAFLVVASFIEDIGLLCHKRYVRIEDINDIIGSGLLYQITLMLEQICHERRIAPDPARSRSRYAFALWLYETITQHPRFGVPGYGAI